MASVYEAVHEPSGQRSAVKVLHHTFVQNSDVLNRFFNEAKAANLVSHPGVVHIFECGMTPDGVAYLAMEYLDGMSLHERLFHAGGSLPEGTVQLIGMQAASALAVMHEQKIVHRDLKPENIMVVPDKGAAGGERVKILDFGIAKLAMGTGQPGGMMTRTGVLMGTPTYMAPEQCRGARGVDDRADVYALGVIMYQMLAGAPPFGSPGAAEVMAQHVYQPPQPLQQRAPQVSTKLASLVDQMLRKQPGTRPSMAAVEKRLAAMAGLGPDPETEDPSATLVFAADGPGQPPALAGTTGSEAKTHVGDPIALLPPSAPTQVAQEPTAKTQVTAESPADAQTRKVAALAPPTAPTQFQDEARPRSEPLTQVHVPVVETPSPRRPNEVRQPTEDLRQHAMTKLVAIVPTVFQTPPQPTLFESAAPSSRPPPSPPRTLYLSLLGALLMSVLLLVLYALLG
jgi:serine/threonine-protein kinase